MTTWLKSTRCVGGECAEVAFVTSSRCGSSACVAVGRTADAVLLRDSKTPDGPVLEVSPAAWTAFLAAIRAGHYDTPAAAAQP